MDADELYEMKRSRELEIEEAFFIWHYSIPDQFTQKPARTYKIGDKYVVELSYLDKQCTMKLEIDREYYDKVDRYVREFVTKYDKDDYDMGYIIVYIAQMIIKGGEE